MSAKDLVDLFTAVAGFGALWRELRALRRDLVGHQAITDQRHLATTQRLDKHEDRIGALERGKAA